MEWIELLDCFYSNRFVRKKEPYIYMNKDKGKLLRCFRENVSCTYHQEKKEGKNMKHFK